MNIYEKFFFCGYIYIYIIYIFTLYILATVLLNIEVSLKLLKLS